MDQWRNSNFFTYYSTNDKTETKPKPQTPETDNDKMKSGGKTTEIKLNPPKVFTGKQNDLNKFLQDVTLYLSINKEIYDKDEKKIAFMLSFMTEGDAASWKEESLARKIDKADQAEKDLTLGTFCEVKDAVKKFFKPFDGPGDALEEMKTLRMASSGNIDEHVAKFRMMVTKSGLMALAAVMDLFQETLPTPLQKQVMTCENPLTTLNQWYEKSTKFHSNW